MKYDKVFGQVLLSKKRIRRKLEEMDVHYNKYKILMINI